MAPISENPPYLVLFLNFHLLGLLLVVLNFWLQRYCLTESNTALLFVILNLWFGKLYFGIIVTIWMLFYLLVVWWFGIYLLP